MGLETVADDIKQEARARAEEIVEEAEEEKEDVLSEARQEAESLKQEAEEEAESEAESLREQEISSAKLEARKMMSREERELLADLREDVRGELADIEQGREEMTRTLLQAGVEELDEEEAVAYCAEDDEETVSELVDEFDGVEFGGTEEMLGGVIVESSDGRVRVDNSFDSVLETVWNDSVREVSERLLGEE
jgi:V/A-type H+-transporting ATPase subunit E